ncbi:MAG: (d)CMP kinase, partial [Fibrobacterota bacterium]
MKDSYVIAIDGPSGSGKSTTAARVAEKLGI